jgi:hypothetical protein
MKQDEIIEMAKQAGASADGRLWLMYSEDLEAFAKLVAAKEREACAKVCDDLYRVWTLTDEDDLNPPDALDCKRAIRARKEL